MEVMETLVILILIGVLAIIAIPLGFMAYAGYLILKESFKK